MHPEVRAGPDQLDQVREVATDRVALDARPLRDGLDGRLGRADVPVELERRADDPLAGVVHGLGAALHRVTPSRPRYFVYHLCSINR